MAVSLQYVLDLPSVQAGNPAVLSGSTRLDRPLRWVHVTDVRDVGAVLAGDELVLTSGLAMAPSGEAAAGIVDQLIDAGAAGLMIELGVDYPEVDEAALIRAQRADFPLIVLRLPVRFVDITEVVHRAIVAEQFELVRFASDVHESFTGLSLDRASVPRIVEAAARLLGSSVVLEDLRRRVIAFAAVNVTTEQLLLDWERRSRLSPVLPETGITGTEEWTTTPVGIQGGAWGRMVLMRETENSSRGPLVLERAAQALELGRMMERDEIAVQLRVHGGFLLALLENRFGTELDALSRLRSLGVQRGQAFVALVVRRDDRPPADGHAAQRRLLRLSEDVTESLRAADLDGIVGPIDSEHIGVVLSLPRADREEECLRSLSSAVTSREHAVRIGAGMSSADLLGAAASLRSARSVVDVAVTMPSTPQVYFRHSDVRLHGLMTALSTDPRLQAFAESELGALLEYEARHGGGLIELLRQFLAVGGNKAELARLAHRNRTSLYPRLNRLEEILGYPLEDPASRLSLGVALMAYDQNDETPEP